MSRTHRQAPDGTPDTDQDKRWPEAGRIDPAAFGLTDHPLFPALQARAKGMLEVDAPHRLYWEESGNPDGIPVIFLHGGPGAGSVPAYRRFFNPRHYRIILMDQRGAGRSLPLADLTTNTTAALVADLETLRAHLGVEKWLVFGGSWGSTLALAYGQAHPDRCLGFVLRGIFLFTAWEVDWFLNGMGTFFPEAAHAFRTFLPEDERPFLLDSYHARLTSPDPAIHEPAAVRWCAYENACSRLIPDPPRKTGPETFYPGALAMARIEAHYMKNSGFLKEGQLMENLPRIAHLPAIIVQGRYDTVCPIRTAFALASAWPAATFLPVATGGHSSLDPAVRSALVEATEAFRHRLADSLT